jgi:hypothetical protein
MTIEHPDHGGRVRLELREEMEQGALYAVTLFTPAGRWEATARVELTAAAAVPQCGEWTAEDPSSGAAPPWLARYASSMLAVLQRDHRAAQGSRWPRRILRWRAERA